MGESERAAEPDQGERPKRSGELPMQDFDVIYIGGIPPLRQIWADIKTVIRQRREMRQWGGERSRMSSRAERGRDDGRTDEPR